MRFERHEIGDVKVCIPISESYKDCMDLIKSDRFRIAGKISSSLRIILQNLRLFRSTTLFWFKLAQHKGFLYPICVIMYKISSMRSLIQLSLPCKVGYGLYLGHEMCMVINAGTIIGNNVYIGPHVSIVENVKIGDNSTIGAGPVVTKDVLQNSTVAGSPARILNQNNPGRYLNNRYKY